MKDLIAKLYRHIAGTGERQPTINQVRAALGPSAPCRDLLQAWRSDKSEKIPSFEQLLYLLSMTEKAGHAEPLFRMGAYMKWCRAAEAQWSGKPEGAATLEGEEA